LRRAKTAPVIVAREGSRRGGWGLNRAVLVKRQRQYYVSYPSLDQVLTLCCLSSFETLCLLEAELPVTDAHRHAQAQRHTCAGTHAYVHAYSHTHMHCLG